LNAGTALPGFNERLVLKTGGWVGPDTSGDSYCMNPSVPEVRNSFLRYTDALLQHYGDVADVLVWDETFMIAADSFGSAEVAGYSSRAMMRLVRQISCKGVTRRQHAGQILAVYQPGVSYKNEPSGAAGQAQ